MYISVNPLLLYTSGVQASTLQMVTFGVLPMVPLVILPMVPLVGIWYHWLTIGTNCTIGRANGTIGITIGTNGIIIGTIGKTLNDIGTIVKPRTHAMLNKKFEFHLFFVSMVIPHLILCKPDKPDFIRPTKTSSITWLKQNAFEKNAQNSRNK